MKKLYNLALAARKKAYAPYSKFKVGAALETKSGKIFTGCNVENVSYGATICAERVAISKAVSEGEKKFARILIVTDTKKPAAPCGVCRQVLSEFGMDIEVIFTNLKGEMKSQSLKDLLPEPVRPEMLKNH